MTQCNPPGAYSASREHLPERLRAVGIRFLRHRSRAAITDMGGGRDWASSLSSTLTAYRTSSTHGA
jgi:hypothetical protein